MSNTKTISIYSEKLNKNFDINIVDNFVVIGDTAKACNAVTRSSQCDSIWNNIWYNSWMNWFNNWCW